MYRGEIASSRYNTSLVGLQAAKHKFSVPVAVVLLRGFYVYIINDIKFCRGDIFISKKNIGKLLLRNLHDTPSVPKILNGFQIWQMELHGF